ncbi:MAG TPA: NmrA/HSCARG family protein, partial [Povalibacter sp.]|nr:NmrA/HSCARG family protein [Povalibacter sp.]
MRVLVIGATGAQGGSVARHLLTTGRHKVRCLTRTPDSSSAMALKQSGAEIVRGNLDEPATLRAVLHDCDAVFGVTNYWEHGEKEFAHGRNLVDAIRHSDVQHTILSTLPHTRLLSGGRLEVPHFDTKARIEEYARELDLPCTYLHVAFYYENFLNALPPQLQPDGTYVFAFPQGNVPLAAVAAA